jgi:hypothetical protein
MGVVEDVGQVLQDFLAPEMREIRGQLAAVNQRIDALEEISRVRHESIVQRLELIQQSFAFDRRISDLETKKKRSA